MTDMSNYVAYAEVKPLTAAALGEGVVGAFVRCYSVGSDAQDAGRRIQNALKASDLQLIEFEWCVNDDEVQWEHADDPEGQAHVREARSSGEVVFGDFHVWRDEAVD